MNECNRRCFIFIFRSNQTKKLTCLTTYFSLNHCIEWSLYSQIQMNERQTLENVPLIFEHETAMYFFEITVKHYTFGSRIERICYNRGKTTRTQNRERRGRGSKSPRGGSYGCALRSDFCLRAGGGGGGGRGPGYFRCCCSK